MGRLFRGREILQRGLIALPAILAFILAVPCLRFSFISDDFAFLQRAASFSPTQLVPDPRSAFYRPIPRELYFAFLTLLSPNNSLWGHLINALLLAAAVTLTVIFAWRIGGKRLGLLSGIFLAFLGPLPFLVGWVSCAQDLFAMIFIMAALNLELSGRKTLSIVCFGAALLSKETAAFFLPALMSLRYLATGNRRELMGSGVRYLGLAIVWGAAHHKIRAFLLHGFATGAGGYVGVDNPFMLRNSIRMAGTLVNLSPTGLKTPWPPELTLPFVAVLLLLGVLCWVGPRDVRENPTHQLQSTRILWIGGVLGLLPAVLTVASAKHWFPYYSCMPAMGTSILLAFSLRKVAWRSAIAAAAVFLILGVWYRGTDTGKITIPAEANFRAGSNCLKRVEGDLRKLHSQFPDSSRVYVAVEMPPDAGVHIHLWHVQALRTWYVNRTIVSMPPEYQDTTYWPRYLFWVNPACEVFEIKLPELRVRSPGPRPDYFAYQRTVRSYAMGAWASGDVDRGVAVLLNMQEVNRMSWEFDRRLAATLLIASGREAEAARLREGLSKISREQALSGVAAVLGPEVPRPGLDEASFRVFGLEANDAEAFRDLMFFFSDRIRLEKTKRMAERLLELRPGDEDATAMLEELRKVPKWEGVLVPPEGAVDFPRIY